MKTIEERAKDYNNKCTYACGMECNVGELAYIKGAAEQHEIDIKNACDAYCKVCGHFAHTTPIEICRHDCHYYDDFVRIIKGIKRE